MAIDRRGQTEKLLENAVDAGRLIKILAAHDMGDALRGIVDDNGQMIACRHIAPRQNDIAPGPWFGAHIAGASVLAEFRPYDLAADLGERPFHVEPERIGRSAPDALVTLGCAQFAAGAGIKRRAIGIAGSIGSRCGANIAARTETGIDEPAR